MALLDNLSKKASAVSSMAIQKAKDLSEISRLNSQISEEENQKKNAFHKMGQLYYSLHSNDYSDDFKPLISSVIESENKIAELKRQIDLLKGIQRCKKCGTELEKNAAFCSNCGASVPKSTELVWEGKTICKNCGASATKGSRFCTSCGKPMESAPQQQEETEQSKRICPNCGAAIDEDSLFCTNCGQKYQKDVTSELEDKPVEPVSPPQEETAQAKRICLNCGSIVDEDSLFCTNCGQKYQEDVALKSEDTPVEPVLPPQEEPEQAKRLCSNCGSIVAEDSLFCTNCGQKYQEDVASEADKNPVELVLPPQEKPEQVKRVCQNCGAMVAEDSLFCMSCGRKYQEDAVLESEDTPVEPILPPKNETEQVKRICPNCGAMVDEDSLFCMSCGRKYQEDAVLESEDKPVEPILPPQNETEQVKRICPNCGAMVDEDFLFCTKCGWKLAEYRG